MEEATRVKALSPQALAIRMGISPKQLRSILRTEHSRDVKNKRWEIIPTLARKVEKDYKAKVRESEARKQSEIKKQLEGRE